MYPAGGAVRQDKTAVGYGPARARRPLAILGVTRTFAPEEVEQARELPGQGHDRPGRAAHGLILHQREQAGRRTLSAGQLEERGEELNRACPLERAHVGGALDDHNPVAQQLAVDDEVL